MAMVDGFSYQPSISDSHQPLAISHVESCPAYPSSYLMGKNPRRGKHLSQITVGINAAMLYNVVTSHVTPTPSAFT
jgi:hypothetical protein